MNKSRRPIEFSLPVLTAIVFTLAVPILNAKSPPEATPATAASQEQSTTKAAATGGCPTANWATEVLPTFAQASATVPTAAPQSFCEFHQTTFESFVWATAMINGAPRFLSLKTPDQLMTAIPASKNAAAGTTLNLASRNHSPSPGQSEGAGAIVEADGNMLVGPNGYPIYASVHMNDSYFNSAQANLIATGAYQKGTDNFNVGAAVFKATWLRLGNGVNAPAGSFTTTATVPVLAANGGVIAPGGSTVEVKVALVGLHVVELTDEHPEFLWGTFEHNLNAPMLADGTYTPTGSNPNNFTLYKAGTTFGNTNQANQSNGSQPQVASTFNASAQTFSPTQNVAQLNKTGGDPSGTVPQVNAAGQQYLTSQKSVFANYVMIGTVWFAPNSFVMPNATSMGAAQGVGSVNLANTTAETFAQMPQNSFGQPVNNCFSCHNTNSYTFQVPPLTARLIATSHVLAQGTTTYAVANQVLLNTSSPPPSPAQKD